MKNLIYTFAAVILVTFAACDKNDKNINDLNANETENAYSDEEILANVKFVGQGILLKNNSYDGAPQKIANGIQGVGITASWRIATKRSGCKDGFGLCDGKIKKNENIYSLDDNTIYLPLEHVNFDNLVLELAEIPLIDMTNVRFNIDEDVYVTDEETGTAYAKVQANAYEYDATVGSAGGFKLVSKSLIGE